MENRFMYNRIEFLYAVISIGIIFSLLGTINSQPVNETDLNLSDVETNLLVEVTNSSIQPRCIPSGIDAFPSDFLTQEQRLKGGVVIHFIITFYVSLMIGVVCKDYFIPSLEIISDSLSLPPDIAGATFMAIGTSAPELFSSLTGSFITEGDIGVGTIIGSAVYNIVGVSGIVGIVLWNEVLDIDWYPIARDCSVYGVTVISLIWIISDNMVTWWESLVLLFIFVMYIAIMSFNKRIEAASRKLVNKKKRCCCCGDGEKSPLLRRKIIIPEIDGILREEGRADRDSFSFSTEVTASRQNSVLQKDFIEAKIEELIYEDEARDGSICSIPQGGKLKIVSWFLMYPAKFLFYLTIPDSDSKYKLYPLTFFISVLWIGVLSYVAVWMVTIIGFTFSIPDSISGLTILAIGTSVPEVITSIIVARNGYGNMSISNLVGSNTFDISFCLGLPWLVKILISKDKYLIVYSHALTYTTATLLVTLVVFVLVFQLSHWKFNRTVGLTFLFIYIVFLVLSCMYELNVFGHINMPTCAH